MPKKWVIDRTHIELLKLRASGFSYRKIADKLKCSESNIAQKAKGLRAHGYLTVDNYPTPLGLEVISPSFDNRLINSGYDFHPVGDRLITQDYQKETQRLHALQLKVPLRNPMTENGRMKLSCIKDMQLIEAPSRRELKHHVDLLIKTVDATVIVTSKNVIFSGFQTELPLDISTYDLLHIAWKKAINFVRQFEAKARKVQPRFALMKDDRDIFSMEVIRVEIAHTHNVIAEHILRTGDQFILKDPKDGLPRVIVDNSKNGKELEFVHKNYAVEDAEKQRKFEQAIGGRDRTERFMYDLIIDEQIDPWKDHKDVQDLRDIIFEIAESIIITQSHIQTILARLLASDEQ